MIRRNSKRTPGESKPFIRNIFALGECAHIVGSQVISHKDERKLLQGWSTFVQRVDPDIIIGYNISNFDFPYLMDRANHLKITGFPYLGRLRGIISVNFSISADTVK
jgi:DNA polymerase delta subunit 1